MLNFNHIKWLQQFSEASKNRTGFKELRATIFQQTVQIAKNGNYDVHGITVKLPPNDLINHTAFYTNTVPLTISNQNRTKVAVIQGDCLEAAQLLIKSGLNPVVLNMANLYNPGGGVLNGSGAQEENLFRRSNLFQSLYQYAHYSDQYNIPRNPNHSYPMHPRTGAIYSPNVTVFSASEQAGYALLQLPYLVDIISVAALDSPQLVKVNNEYRLNTHDAETTKEKIRSIYRVSAIHGNDSMVLSALGCGAFSNPPQHIAELFRDVLKEKEFNSAFKLVVLAIIDDHNTHRSHNPQGNYLPFVEVFE